MLSSTLTNGHDGHAGLHLTPARRRLIDLLTRVHFGRLLDLHVCRGEPVIGEGAPRVIRTVKLSGTNQLPHTRGPSDAARREVVDLMRLLDEVGNGVIGRIEIAHGQALLAEVHESAAAS